MNRARHARPIDVAAPEFRVVHPNTVLDGLNTFPTLSDTRSRNLLIAQLPPRPAPAVCLTSLRGRNRGRNDQSTISDA